MADSRCRRRDLSCESLHRGRVRFAGCRKTVVVLEILQRGARQAADPPIDRTRAVREIREIQLCGAYGEVRQRTGGKFRIRRGEVRVISILGVRRTVVALCKTRTVMRAKRDRKSVV